MRRPRIHVHISAAVNQKLVAAATKTGASRASIVDAALAVFLDPDEDKRREAVLLRRLGRIDQKLDRLDTDLGITAETLAAFVRYMMATVQIGSDLDQPTMQAKGKERFERLMHEVVRKTAHRSREDKSI